jgi:hypothetical protein
MLKSKITTGDILSATMLLLMLMALGTINAALFEKPFLSYPNSPFPVLAKQVEQGAQIPLQIERCNADNVPHTYTTARALINLSEGYSTVLSDSIVQIKPGCSRVIGLASRVPMEIKPGKYRLIGTAEIHGFFKTHLVEWGSEEFEVIPKRVLP